MMSKVFKKDYYDSYLYMNYRSEALERRVLSSRELGGK